MGTRTDAAEEHPSPLPLCPKCGGKEAKPILYGYPTREAMEAAKRGEIALGGCVVHGDDPQWRCAGCGFGFR